ncbi:MAG: PQQ-binding-like beta-propeller repeat protein [Gemmatimonadota bacterium]
MFRSSYVYAASFVTSIALITGLNPAAISGQDSAAAEGEALFQARCAECHSDEQSGRTPTRFSLNSMTPRAIVAALRDGGVMDREGASMTDPERITLAEHLTGRAFSAELVPDDAYCSDRGPAPLDLDRVRWMGYGGDLEGTGFQPEARAGLSADEVPELELLWAFGFPGASQVRTKPTVAGDVLLVGDQFGGVYALEARTGCVRWTFEAESGVRGAIPVAEDAQGRSIAYVVDARTTAYALDTATGDVLWRTRVGWHPESNNTGSATVADGKLIIPISTMGEVVAAVSPTYECCTSSGAVAALDVETGDLAWYHRVIQEPAVEAATNAVGTQLWAPSGAPVWSSPTVDLARGRVYAGSGENLSRPTNATSDAILSIRLDDGELDWVFQATEGDAFTMACTTRAQQNCPAPPGPDVDFGMSPMIVERSDGTEVLVAGQKSGTVWGLDPDDGGAVLWSTQIGKGGVLGGIHWGMATDGRYAYAANADRGQTTVDINPEMEWSPGIFAIDLFTGAVVWETPTPEGVCNGRRGCYRANSAAPTLIPGVLFAGGLDGYMRAYDTETGEIIWEMDTVRDWETVNGVPARGGAIDGPGPVIADGIVYVNSGYSTFSQMPGNVLLAFSVPDR